MHELEAFVCVLHSMCINMRNYIAICCLDVQYYMVKVEAGSIVQILKLHQSRDNDSKVCRN